MPGLRLRLRPLRRLRCVACLVAALAAASAGAFELSLQDPALTLVVPALPAIPLATQSTPPPGSVLMLAGSGGGYSAALLITPSAAAASPRTCAGSFLRSLVARPGMPDRDSIYRAPLNDRTFLVLYILGTPPNRVQHAHLLSAAGPQRCVEARFSQALAVDGDEDAWRRAFIGAHFD